MKILTCYLLILNFLSFILMMIDKKRAIHHKWRISEKALFFCAFLGGSLGIGLGMLLFHHKTKKWYFILGIPILFITNLIFLYLILQIIL